MFEPVTPAQCKIARDLLDWSVREFARHAGAATKTIRDFEKGLPKTRRHVVLGLKKVLEEAGIEFIEPKDKAPEAHAGVQSKVVQLTDGSVVRLTCPGGDNTSPP